MPKSKVKIMRNLKIPRLGLDLSYQMEEVQEKRRILNTSIAKSVDTNRTKGGKSISTKGQFMTKLDPTLVIFAAKLLVTIKI